MFVLMSLTSCFFIVSCQPGSFWNGYISQYLRPRPDIFREVHYPTCSLCSVGYYQDDIGSINCKQCPQNHSTIAEGSKSLNDCKGEQCL